MIFGLVTFAKSKQHPPSSLNMSAMTRLNFEGEVGKLGGGMWMWGAKQLYHGYSLLKSQVDNIFSYPWPIRYDIANIGIKLGFHWQMTHVEFANDVHLHNFER